MNVQWSSSYVPQHQVTTLVEFHYSLESGNSYVCIIQSLVCSTHRLVHYGGWYYTHRLVLYTQAGTIHTGWYYTHRLVLYTQAGTLHTGWYSTHRLVLHTQAGTIHTGWYSTHRLVLYTQAGTIHTGWYSTHRLVCTYVRIYTNLFPRDLVISHLMHQINVHLLSAQ